MSQSQQMLQNTLEHLLGLAAQRPDSLATMLRYVSKWVHWIKLGRATTKESGERFDTLSTSIAICWDPGSKALTLSLFQQSLFGIIFKDRSEIFVETVGVCVTS